MSSFAVTRSSTANAETRYKRTKSEDCDAAVRQATPARSLKRIKINVSGQLFKTYEETLERMPNTLLGDKTRREEFYDESCDEYFFDRHRESFSAILYFYQSDGIMERPKWIPLDLFIEEIIFFDLSYQFIGEIKPVAIVQEEETSSKDTSLRSVIWETLENPTTKCGRIVASASIFFILIATVSFCVETLPQFQNSENESEIIPPWDSANKGFPFWVIESICIVFFTIEFALRLFCTPHICKFLKTIGNLIDLLAIVPYYFSLTVQILLLKDELPGGEENGSGDNLKGDKVAFLAVLRIIRILRVFRIAKLGRHNQNLSRLVRTMKGSAKEFSFLFLLFGVFMVIFSALVYFAENGQNEKMNSIPASFWWAIVTMTTVGYGDVVPITVPGKMVGLLCALSGVLCIALPVPAIVQNFHRIFKEDKALMEFSDDYSYDGRLRSSLRRYFMLKKN